MISLNTGKYLQDLKYYLYVQLEKIAERFAEYMRQEIPDGNLPGKPEWRDKQRDDITVLNKMMANDYASMVVGIPYDQNGSWEFVRAMLINYGGGSRAEPPNDPIQHFPETEVWNDDLDGRIISNNDPHYYLPKGFNQYGSHYFENACRRIVKEYYDEMEKFFRVFPMRLYVSSNVQQVRR